MFAAFILCFSYSEPLMAFVLEPMIGALAGLGYPPQVVFVKAQEKFIAYLKLSAVAAAFVASPVCLYQAWAFVATGLYPTERRYVLTFAPASLLSFVSGVLFFYFLVLPWGLQFLIGFGGDPSIRPMIQVSEHISFFMMLSLIMGLVFELPLVMLFLTKIRVVSWEAFAAKRRFAVLFNFVAAAVLTPPDVFTQIMLALPMCLLYEIGILVSRIGMVEADGEVGARINLRGLFLLLLPTMLIAALVTVKLTRFPETGARGAGRQLDDATYARVLARLGQAPGEAWLELLRSADGRTRLEGLERLGQSAVADKQQRLRRLMREDADPALQALAAALLFESGQRREAAARLVELLESAPLPRYAYLAHRLLERLAARTRALPPRPDSKQVAAAAAYWRGWLAELK